MLRGVTMFSFRTLRFLNTVDCSNGNALLLGDFPRRLASLDPGPNRRVALFPRLRPRVLGQHLSPAAGAAQQLRHRLEVGGTTSSCRAANSWARRNSAGHVAARA